MTATKPDADAIVEELVLYFRDAHWAFRFGAPRTSRRAIDRLCDVYGLKAVNAALKQHQRYLERLLRQAKADHLKRSAEGL
jgi:hypothetical protein